MELDSKDRRILKVLQQNGRINNADLANEVGLSASPCLRRVKLLEDAGVIARYVALLNPAKLGLGMTMFVRVWLKAPDSETVGQFTAAILDMPKVVECHLMAGDCDFLLRVVVSDFDDYRRFQVEQLGSIPAVQQFKTEIPMQTVKSTSELPL